MNPYNHNPFKTDTKKIRNERDANRELANTLRNVATPTRPNLWELVYGKGEK